MKKLSKKDDLFRLLLHGAQENDCYTVPDLCRKIGIPYAQVQRWAHDDYRWSDVLEVCRERCLDNVEVAAMMKRMRFREALKYIDRLASTL